MSQKIIKKRPVFFIAIMGILMLLGLSPSLYRYLMREKEPLPLPIEVQTVRVKEVSMPELIETVGTLAAKDEITIKAAGAGKIQRILVESGSLVRQGTLLAETVGSPEIRAPFDGYLTDWLVKPGEYVGVGTALIDLVNTESLSLTYRVPESYSSKLNVEQTVEVSVKAFPNEIFQSVVKYVAPVVDKKTYTILIRATVKNSDQRLWPGMSAHVRQILKEYPNALVIPEAALILTLEGYEVFVIIDGKIEKRTVSIGTRRQGRVHVLSGLKLGDAVVLVRTSLITEGSAASPNDWAGDW